MGTKSIPLCSPKLTILGEKNSARHTMQRARNFLVEREREYVCGVLAGFIRSW